MKPFVFSLSKNIVLDLNLNLDLDLDLDLDLNLLDCPWRTILQMT
jgi:hypothetical protein